jgi:glucose-1-phosphate cytidylyltransferase
MNIFSTQGYEEFVLALGYRGDVIKRWLLDLNDLAGNITIDTLKKKVHHLQADSELSWKVTAIETGLNTQTGGRIAQCMRAFPGERIIATYGDGLANVNIKALLAFHESHGKLATVTAVRPPARFGYLDIEANRVAHFGEKNQADAGWINGGFFVLEPEVANYVESDSEPFESGALPRLVEESQLMAYHHEDFWQPMDTLREKQELTKFALLDSPPWLNFNTKGGK